MKCSCGFETDSSLEFKKHALHSLGKHLIKNLDGASSVLIPEKKILDEEFGWGAIKVIDCRTGEEALSMGAVTKVVINPPSLLPTSNEVEFFSSGGYCVVIGRAALDVVFGKIASEEVITRLK